MLFVLFIAFVLFVAFLTWYFYAEGDLSLLYCEKYGVKITEAFSGKVVWIIGSASGIGEQLAYKLVHCGARVILSDRNAEDLEKVRRACVEIGVPQSHVLSLPFDVTDFKNHQNYVNEAVSHFSKVDVVFHNAGCTMKANFHEVATEVDHELFDINCLGHVALARPIIKHFLANGGGHFVVTSSALGLYGLPQTSTYVGTKFAVRGFFEAIRSEYFKQRITVTTIFPGAVFSNIFNKMYTGESGQFFIAGMKPTDRRMKTSRCAQLIAVAAANGLEEAWIATNPFLHLLYFAQYTPVLFKRYIMKRYFDPERADDFRNGRLL